MCVVWEEDIVYVQVSAFVSVCWGCGLLTSHDEEEEHHDEGVAKVEQVAKDACDGSLEVV